MTCDRAKIDEKESALPVSDASMHSAAHLLRAIDVHILLANTTGDNQF